MKGYLIAAWIAIAALGWTVLLLWRENERQDREIRAALGSAESANYGVQSQVANALREQKRQSDFASARYFPERAFDDDLVRDTILADVYSRPLRSLQFPPFATWVREQRLRNSSWGDPQFRLLKTTPGGVTLLAHVFFERTPAYEGGGPRFEADRLVVRPYDPKMDLSQNNTNFTTLFRLRPEQRSSFEERIKRMKFWEMPGIAGSGSGDRQRLEGVDGDRYHVVVREGDSSKDLVELFAVIAGVADRVRKSQSSSTQQSVKDKASR
jgi:hypothetical protein